MDFQWAGFWVLFLALCHCGDGRQGRLIFMNTESSIDIALQAIVPFGVALPMVKKEKERRRNRSWNPRNVTEDYLDPLYGPQLAKLDAYFNFLEVEDELCRRKIICELGNTPDQYYPVSDAILKQLIFPVPEDSYDESRYWEYLRAIELGSDSSCEDLFSSCNLRAQDIFDMDAINFWKFLASIFHFKIN